MILLSSNALRIVLLFALLILARQDPFAALVIFTVYVSWLLIKRTVRRYAFRS